MHEFGFAQALVDNVVKIASEKGARRVSKVVVEVGDLLLINPEQLKFCYEVLTKNTVLEGSKLEIVNVKAKLVCENCGKEFHELALLCECGGHLKVEKGEEFILKRVIMEVDNAQNRS